MAAAPATRSEHVVFDLGANRLLAHALRGGGLYVDAGSAGLVKYLRFGGGPRPWQRGQERDGVRCAVPPATTSMMLPLSAEQAASAAEITVRVHAPRADHLRLSIGGKTLGERALAAGWQTVTIPVAAGRLHAGTDELELHRRDSIAIAWLQVGGDAGGGAPRWADGALHLPA
ncbi:MAG TPA: hypothetical protein VL172_07005, partial [Kofleriaceae bacterium]|nr:hypothetical protein [Kofleriaceae bacterium]